MRLLGIDYGTKRVGTALSDENGEMAFPYRTYPNNSALVEHLTELCMEKEVGAIVVGESEDLSGAPNPVQADINTFIEALRTHVRIPVHLESERFSTQAALRIQGHTDATDASAAALILDAYITRTNQTNNP